MKKKSENCLPCEIEFDAKERSICVVEGVPMCDYHYKVYLKMIEGSHETED